MNNFRNVIPSLIIIGVSVLLAACNSASGAPTGNANMAQTLIKSETTNTDDVENSMSAINVMYIADSAQDTVNYYIVYNNTESTEIVLLGGYHTDKQPYSATIWKNQSGNAKLLYVPCVSDHSIAVYGIHEESSGALTWQNRNYDLGKGNTPAEPRYVAISPNGKYAFASDHARKVIDVFSINTADESSPDFGALSMIDSKATDDNTAPNHLIVDPNGKYLYVEVENSNKTFLTYTIGSDGKINKLLNSVSIDGGTGLAFAISSNKKYLYGSDNGRVAKYDTDSESAVIHSASVESLFNTPIAMAATSNIESKLNFLYVADSVKKSINICNIDSVTGNLDCNESPQSVEDVIKNSYSPTAMVISPDNLFLTVISTPSGMILRYKIADNGTLTFASSRFEPNGARLNDIATADLHTLCGKNHDMACMVFVALDTTWYGNMDHDSTKNTVSSDAADQHCMAAATAPLNSSHLPEKYRDTNKVTYKALLVGRDATTPGRDYYQVDDKTLIATATSGNLAGFLQNPIYKAYSEGDIAEPAIWTGFYPDRSEDKFQENCSKFTSASYSCDTDDANCKDEHSPLGNAAMKETNWQSIANANCRREAHYIACVTQ